MKGIFVLGIIFIISSLVHVVEWTTDEALNFYKKKQLPYTIFCLALAVILVLAHIVLLDKVILYYAEEFLK